MIAIIKINITINISVFSISILGILTHKIRLLLIKIRGKHEFRKKILIADDEANIRILMEQVLERLEDEGVELLIVENGKEALETIEDEKPDLVFLDMMMPKMNGLDVCKAVKQELKIPNIYIIMLTAKGQEDDKEKGLQMGADLYMTKPFRPKSILEKSREVLGI